MASKTNGFQVTVLNLNQRDYWLSELESEPRPHHPGQRSESGPRPHVRAPRRPTLCMVTEASGWQDYWLSSHGPKLEPAGETIGTPSPGRGHITRARGCIASGWIQPLVSIQPLRNLILIELLIAPLKKCPGITDSTQCKVLDASWAD